MFYEHGLKISFTPQVEQLQNFSVQQAAAGGSAMNSGGSQQPGDAQRLLLQRQVAADQLKRQFGPPAGSTGNPGK